jgi:dolichol-phosphate mannosyltransferase
MSLAAVPGVASATRGPWVVVPTYNEVDNLPVLVGRLLAVLAGRPGATILVVDDNSPDGTGQLAGALAAEDPRIRVLHRQGKEGLGAAYADGFRYALRHGATHVVQMDADLSHDPAAVADLLDAAQEADVVIGSRYVPGGSTPDWPTGRRLLSRGGSLYARLVLGLAVRDLTGGFKCWRAPALAAAIADNPTLQGYGFQIELTHRALRAGFRAAEVPICFRDRELGESKMDSRIVVEAMLGVPRLRRTPRAERAAAGSTAPVRAGAAA